MKTAGRVALEPWIRATSFGLGILAATVVATLTGIPPTIWLSAVLAVVALVLLVAIRQARSDGSHDATRMLAQLTTEPTAAYSLGHSESQRVNASESPWSVMTTSVPTTVAVRWLRPLG